MCIVSAISDYGMNRIPQQYFQDPQIAVIWVKLNELAAKVDALTGQPNCVDPAKEKFLNDLMEFMKEKKGE